LLLFLAALVAACSGNGEATPPPGVWATVDGRPITQDEVEKAYRRLAQKDQEISDEEALAAKLQILDQMVDQEVLIGRAQATNVSVTDSEVDVAFGQRKGTVTDQQFQAELDSRKLTADDLKRGLRRELTVQKLIEQEVTNKVTVSDDQVREFYEKNRAQFNVAETRFRLSQIVITPVRDPQIRNRLNSDATTAAEAQRKAQMIADRLRGGADFGELAADFSEDPQTAPQGGDLGFVTLTQLNQLPARLRDVVLKTEPGNVSSVGGDGAITLVFVASRDEAGQRDLNSPGVKDGITKMLRDRREQVLREAYITSARSEARVVNHLARQIVQAQGAPPSLAVK
jgi:peptidyl-prolyl cis-trans isomerase SurA